MYKNGGLSYVYLIYGMYCCFNVVTCPENQPEAVLIRSAKPIEGMEQMAEETVKALCELLGVTYEPPVLYRVQVGAYGVKANAEAMVARLKAAGFEAIVV